MKHEHFCCWFNEDVQMRLFKSISLHWTCQWRENHVLFPLFQLRRIWSVVIKTKRTEGSNKSSFGQEASRYHGRLTDVSNMVVSILFYLFNHSFIYSLQTSFLQVFINYTILNYSEY